MQVGVLAGFTWLTWTPEVRSDVGLLGKSSSWGQLKGVPPRVCMDAVTKLSGKTVKEKKKATQGREANIF